MSEFVYRDGAVYRDGVVVSVIWELRGNTAKNLWKHRSFPRVTDLVPDGIYIEFMEFDRFEILEPSNPSTYHFVSITRDAYRKHWYSIPADYKGPVFPYIGGRPWTSAVAPIHDDTKLPEATRCPLIVSKTMRGWKALDYRSDDPFEVEVFVADSPDPGKLVTAPELFEEMQHVLCTESLYVDIDAAGHLRAGGVVVEYKHEAFRAPCTRVYSQGLRLALSLHVGDLRVHRTWNAVYIVSTHTTRLPVVNKSKKEILACGL